MNDILVVKFKDSGRLLSHAKIKPFSVQIRCIVLNTVLTGFSIVKNKLKMFRFFLNKFELTALIKKEKMRKI